MSDRTVTRAPLLPPRGKNPQPKPILNFRPQTALVVSTPSVQKRSWVIAVASRVCRVAKEHPGKTFAYFWACVFLLASPIYGANVALQVQQWGCPKLPPWFAGVIQCPERERIVVRLPEANVPSTAPSLDPRAELFKEMGIAWSEANFWDAVKRGDDRATTLFLRGGMTISSFGLHEVLTDKLFIKKAPLNRFLEIAKRQNREFCSSDDTDGKAKVDEHRSTMRFAGYVKNAASTTFVREFCQGSDLATTLRERLAIETKKIEEQERSAALNRKRQLACISRFETDESARRWSAAVKNRMADCLFPNTDELERGLCKHDFPLLPGWNGWEVNVGNLKNIDYLTGVRDFCRNRFAVRSADTTLRDALAAAVATLIE